MSFTLNPQKMLEVRWSSRGSCGNAGCADPECVCALCAQPIGTSEDDPRREGHDDEVCPGCAICEDDVPVVLFRGEGKGMQEARFHTACFRRLLL
jgi:hypothetical protein